MVKHTAKEDWSIGIPIKAKQGKTESLDKKNQTLLMIDELNKVYGFRRNTVSLTPEFRELDRSPDWIKFGNQSLQTIIIWLKAKGYTVSDRWLQGLLASDFIKAYNPIKHYFDCLTEWDGGDYISELANTIDTDDNVVFRRYFEKWLVGMVRGGYTHNVTNQQMLVFYGKQGIGKTRWFLKLMPKELKEYFFTGHTNLEDQMFKMKLGTYLLIFMDELDSYHGSKHALIKATITQEVVKIRPLYKTFDMEVKRIASFAAAINQENFIHDLTGSRRFLVFETLRINSEHFIDMNKVFSQAFALAKDDSYVHYFSGDELTQLEKRNQRFKAKSDVEFMIEKYMEPSEPDDLTYSVLNATEVIQELRRLCETNTLKANPNSVGTILSSMGFQRDYIGTGNSKRNGYRVKMKS